MLSKLSKEDASKLEILPFEKFERSSVHFIVSKKNPSGEKLINDFNSGLKKIRDSKTLDAIVEEAFAAK